jgi:hypothetical protein
MARTVNQHHGSDTYLYDITVNDLPPHIAHIPADEKLPYRLQGKSYSANTGEVTTTWSMAYATYGQAVLARTQWMDRYGADCPHAEVASR